MSELLLCSLVESLNDYFGYEDMNDRPIVSDNVIDHEYARRSSFVLSFAAVITVEQPTSCRWERVLCAVLVVRVSGSW